MSTELRCPNCNKRCGANDRYCPYCHEPVARVEVFDGNLDGMPLDYWESYIGDNADKYLSVYKANADKKWFRHFHFPAFWITVEWFIYRKMYWQALVIWVTNILIVFSFAGLFNSHPVLSAICLPIVSIAMRFFFGLHAYAMYKQHCLTNIKKGAVANGGTSVVAVIIASVLSNLVTTLVLEPLIIAAFV